MQYLLCVVCRILEENGDEEAAPEAASHRGEQGVDKCWWNSEQSSGAKGTKIKRPIAEELQLDKSQICVDKQYKKKLCPPHFFV